LFLPKLPRLLVRLFGSGAPPPKRTRSRRPAAPGAAEAAPELVAPVPPEPEDDLMVSADDLVAPRREAEAPHPEAPKRPATRAEIIAEALRIQRGKTKILDKLSIEDRARLRLLAEKLMLGGSEGTRH
jgi:hypothetical protein